MRSKISTIYNGVDLEIFKPITLNGQYKENNPVKFLVLGTVKFLKNVIGLAKAFAEQAFDNRVYIAKYEKLFNEIIKQK